MAEAIISRLNLGNKIIVSDISSVRLAFLKKKYKVEISQSNAETFAQGKIIILAVKPQQMREVIREIESRKLKVGSRAQELIVSIAAGVPLKYLEKQLPGYPIIRAMPNNPVLVGEGATALAAGRKVSRPQLKTALEIFSKVGEAIIVPEKWLDAVTGLSGSGPAFVYDTIAALAEGGRRSGLPRKLAEELACQTAIGAIKTFIETGKSHHELKAMVASPGGTTVEGLAVLEKGGFFDLLRDAVMAAAKRSKKISSNYLK